MRVNTCRLHVFSTDSNAILGSQTCYDSAYIIHISIPRNQSPGCETCLSRNKNAHNPTRLSSIFTKLSLCQAYTKKNILSFSFSKWVDHLTKNQETTKRVPMIILSQ